MLEHSVLDHVILGYSPMINRQRGVVATRLTVFPARPDVLPDAHELLRVISEVWPAPEHGARPRVVDKGPGGVDLPLSLNIASEGLLAAVMAAAPGVHVMLEVPAFMAVDPAHADVLTALHAAGNVLLLKGMPRTPLSPELLGCFAHSIVEAADERRSAAGAPAAGGRTLTTIQSAARTSGAVEAAFAQGAAAVLGWQFDDPLPVAAGRGSVPPDLEVVLALINGVERGESPTRLEATLKRDPTLAFRLMRYLNSPAFGLKVEINSFGHALMLLGHQRLKRWLAVLLASSGKDPNAKSLLFAALRRGLLLEQLAGSSDDSETRSELFICGIFSLLDRLLELPIGPLLQSVPVPDRVSRALSANEGPYQPYLELARALEHESALDIRECSERLFMTPAEVNRALLAALGAARQLD